MSISDAQLLFERLIDRLDKPHEYTREISRVLSQLLYASASQQIVLDNGVPFFYDSGRDKTLSLTRPVFRAAAHGAHVTNRYLSMDGVPAAGEQGIYMPRDATITALWAKSRSVAAWTLDVRRNGAALTIASIDIIGSASANHQLNIDVEAGDWLQLFLAGTGVEHPIAAVEVAWRKSN